MPDETYNPLDKHRLAESVAQALLNSPGVRLGDVGAFEGAGIYAIYYHGKFEPYLAVAAVDENGDPTQPIYVGKAIPRGGRKGGWGLGLNPGNVLASRLRQHARSIEDATNLETADFACRYLVVDDVWIPLAESLLIERFAPVWNTVLDGFGNHNPGRGRKAGQRPAWDTVHPGRSWAAGLKENSRTPGEWHTLLRRALGGDPSARLIGVKEAVLDEDSGEH